MTKHNEGFTLVEMVVSILVGTIATAAVATLLLIGLRINATTTEIATRDNQVMIGLTVLSNIAKENEIIEVSTESEKWTVCGPSDDVNNPDTPKTLFYYDKPTQTIYAASGAQLIENVTDSTVEWKADKCTLTINLSIGDEPETYSKTVYSRMSIPVPTENNGGTGGTGDAGETGNGGNNEGTDTGDGTT